MRAIFSYLLIVLLLAVTSSFANQGDPPQFEIEIVSTDSTHPYGVIQGTTISVPIIVNKATHKISGFDFRIAYNPLALTLLTVEPGLFLEQNSWEQFDYEIWPVEVTVCDSAYGVVSIHGSLNDDNNTEIPPANINAGDTLAVMNFHISNDLTLHQFSRF